MVGHNRIFPRLIGKIPKRKVVVIESDKQGQVRSKVIREQNLRVSLFNRAAAKQLTANYRLSRLCWCEREKVQHDAILST